MNAVGLDLGGTNLRAGIVTPGGSIVARRSRPLEDPSDGDAIVRTLAALTGEILKDHEAAAVGIGAAGPLDHGRGVMYAPPNLPGLKEMALAARMADAVGLPAFLENDANAAVFGEHRAGAGEGARAFLGLTLGTGVGGGILLDGVLLRGPDGTAGELGHIVVDPDGIECGCGGKGCLEMVASATATRRRYVDAVRRGETTPLPGFRKELETITAADVFHLAEGGDAFAAKVLDETGRWLGIGIATLVNVFNPDAVVLLGGLAGAWTRFRRALGESFRRHAIQPSRDRVRIQPGTLGNDAGLVGAALLALDRLNSLPGKT